MKNLRPSLWQVQKNVQSEEKNQTELKPKKKNFQAKFAKEARELSDLHNKWEARGKTWSKTRQLEKTFENNDKSRQQQLNQLPGGGAHLQGREGAKNTKNCSHGHIGPADQHTGCTETSTVREMYHC